MLNEKTTRLASEEFGPVLQLQCSTALHERGHRLRKVTATINSKFGRVNSGGVPLESGSVLRAGQQLVASTLLAMASNLKEMASTLVAMASNLVASCYYIVDL